MQKACAIKQAAFLKDQTFSDHLALNTEESYTRWLVLYA
jgi:hypothetical protein